jgi:hypothetical protein
MREMGEEPSKWDTGSGMCIFKDMKQRKDLTLKPENIEEIRQRARRNRTSMSEEVDRAIEHSPSDLGCDEKGPFSKWVGAFSDLFDREDYIADDRVGEELRKTSAYRHMVRKKRTA